MLLSRITKAVFALAVCFFSVMFILVGTLGIWLKTGSKDLDKILPFVVEQLNVPSSPYRVEVGKVVASWDKVTSPIEMQLHHVAVYDKQRQAKLVKLEQVAFSFSFPKLFLLKFTPETMILREPSLRIYREEGNRMFLGIGEERLPLSFDEFTPREKGGSILLSGLRYIAVQNATLHWGEKGGDDSFSAKNLYMRLKKDDDVVTAIFEGMLHHAGGEKAEVKGDAEYHAGRTQVNVQFSGVNPRWFASIWQETYPSITLDAVLQGKVQVVLGNGEEVEEAAFSFFAPKGGVFQDDAHFAERLPFASLHVKGKMQGMGDAVALDHMEVDFHGATLNASGNLVRADGEMIGVIEAEASDMLVNDLYKYWPKTIAPTAYHWVTSHIREGTAGAKLRFLRREEDVGKPLPKDALNVVIHAEGVEVAYLEGHPKAVDVTGEVVFDTQSMTIRSEKGRMLRDSHLKRAYLQIPDLLAPSAPMHIQLEVDALAADVAEYLGNPALNYAAPLGLDPQSITGRMQGDMVFDFRLPDSDLATPYDADLHFMIASRLDAVAQPAFMGNKNVTNATGKLIISEQELTYQGLMQLENSPLTIDLNHKFDKGAPYHTRYTAKGKLDVALLPSFGVPALPFLNGVADINALVEEGEKQDAFKAEADIAGVSIWLPEWGMQKNLGQKGTLAIEGKVAEKVDISRFALTSEPVTLEGVGEFARDFSRIHRLNASKIAFAKHDFSVEVEEQSPGRYHIKARGAALDVASINGKKSDAEQADEAKQEAISSFIKGVDVDMAIDRVIFGPEREITALEVKAECPDMACEWLKASGTYGQKEPFSAQITRKDGKRQLLFSAANAGSFLRALHIYDSIQGGQLHIGGTFDDAEPERPFLGRVIISEHTIVDAPVLAKMVSLLSLSGIGDVLAGKGITFNELKLDITYANGLIVIRKGSTIGPALGITMEEGVVDIENKALRMKGTVIPSYTLNSVLGKIPLIGEVLAGGRGEGIFAATYTVEGRYPDDVDVRVNPLSMLTPGFIRNIFGGVADTVAPQEKTPKEKALEQEAREKETAPQPDEKMDANH